MAEAPTTLATGRVAPAAPAVRVRKPKATSTPSLDVAVLAPTGRDAPIAVEILQRWDVPARMFADMPGLCAAIRSDPRIGVVLIAEEALSPSARDELIVALDAQPSWSDVPILLLTAEGELGRSIAEGIEVVAGRGNVTLLERPVRVATLVTALRSGLRARQRQHDIRNYLAERDNLLDAERKARAEAEQANRAKSEFLAVMSHELRTPLNAIAGYAELLEMGVHGRVTPAQREALGRIQHSERHLLGLINGILNYARVESGKVGYVFSDVAVSEILRMSILLVEPQALGRGLELRCDHVDDHVRVHTDPDKAQQIVLNLLSNAIKFTEPGGRIGISCHTTEAWVVICVTDNGLGIASSKLERIFEPFVQVDARLTRVREGVGLGLAISRDLARGMGGDLRARSELGRGSTFELTLPRVSSHTP